MTKAAGVSTEEITGAAPTAEVQPPWMVAMERDHPQFKKAEEKPAPKPAAQAEENPEEAPEAPKKEDEKENEGEEQPAEEEAQPAEEQPAEPEAEPGKEPEDKEQLPEATPASQKEIAAYALKHEITEEEASEELASNKAILGKYNNDPQELARAYRNSQREYEKLKATAAAPQAIIAEDPREAVSKWVVENGDALVAKYRNEYPMKSSTMEDDVILEELVGQYMVGYNQWVETEKVKIKETAVKKRGELIDSLPAQDKRFLPDIKAMLHKLPDNQVAAQNFRFKDLVNWAKGSKLDQIEKEAEQRGYQRAMKGKKIVGELGKEASPSIPAKKTPAQAATGKMSDFQKKQAEMMFANAYKTKEEMHAAWLEIQPKPKQ